MNTSNATALPTTADLVQWLEATVVRSLQIDPAVVLATRRFDELGVDSMLAAQIARELRRKVQRPVGLNALYEYQCIDSIAREFGAADE
jgi:hypothetical protein